MLHIGDNVTVKQKDIVLILPAEEEGTCKSRILLANGTVLPSAIASTTLKKRLETEPFGGVVSG